MTREEAITVLKAFMENPLFSDEHKAAFNIAIHDIKAHHDWDINNLILINKDNYEPLEQEPTTKNNLGVEYISRSELMSVLSDYYDTTVEYRSMLKEIAALPSVTPQLSSELAKNSKKLEKDFGESDCISRADVIKILDKIEQMVWDGEGFDYEEARAMIDELPSVTPQPRKGHWIESDYGNMITQHRWYCSECGGMHNDPESGEWREVFDFKYDYCPLCGADMREV